MPLAPPRVPLPRRRPSLARYLWGEVAAAGVDAVTGVPGDYSLPLLDALEATPGLRWAGGSTELGAAFAADGYARSRGLGVLCTTWGVGELAAAGASAGWAAEDVAVLHVVGGPSSGRLRSGAPVHHSLADGDAGRTLRVAAATGAVVHVVDPDEPRAAVDAALATWAVDRRPTYLLVPQDQAERAVDGPGAPVPPRGRRPEGPEARARAVRPEARLRAVDLVTRFLAAAPGAVVVPGHLVARRGLRAPLRALADLGAEVAPLPAARALLDLDHAGHLGTYQGPLSDPGVREVVESPRGRVLLGAALTDTATAGFRHDLAAGPTLVVGRDEVRRGDETVAVPIEAAAEVLVEAWRASGRRPDADVRAAASADVRGGVRRDAADRARADARLPADGGPGGTVGPGDDALVAQDVLWPTVAEALPVGWRVVVDPGTATSGLLGAALPRRTTLETATTWAAIGFALPAALGACLADPGERVLAVVGDGAAQVTVQELGLVARCGVRPVVLLVDNGGYAIERLLGDPDAAHHDVPAWDWSAVARGIAGPDLEVARATTVDELRHALGTAVDRPDRAHLVVVRTAPLDAPAALRDVAAALRRSRSRGAAA